MASSTVQHFPIKSFSDNYVITRAKQIVDAVNSCNCEHCRNLIKKANGPSSPPATTSADADINEGQVRYDYRETIHT